MGFSLNFRGLGKGLGSEWRALEKTKAAPTGVTRHRGKELLILDHYGRHAKTEASGTTVATQKVGAQYVGSYPALRPGVVAHYTMRYHDRYLQAHL